jgi:ABC-type glycerol-3-phosphate transport system permease component
MIAAFAAYAFSWMFFPGRQILFVIVVGLPVVLLQMSLIPVLLMYNSIGEFFNMAAKSYLGVWLAHTGFGLSPAIYLLRNYMSGLPRDIIESAKTAGASHFQIFTRIVVPLSVPALASFAIFQFLWVWNDLLVALADGSPVRGLAELSQQAVNQSVTVGVRPEALSPVSEQEGFEHGKVTQVEELGEFHLIYVQTATDHMVVPALVRAFRFADPI